MASQSQGRRAPEDPAVSPRLAARPHIATVGTETVSEGSTWDREGENAVTHALCRAARSCSEGIPARLRQLPSSLCQSLLA